MKLHDEIIAYYSNFKNESNHVFKCGTKVVNIPLKKFLLEWYEQGVQEYKNFGTLNNINAIKKLIS